MTTNRLTAREKIDARIAHMRKLRARCHAAQADTGRYPDWCQRSLYQINLNIRDARMSIKRDTVAEVDR